MSVSSVLYRCAWLPALSGFALLLAAWPLAKALPDRYGEAISYAAMGLFAVACAFVLWRYRRKIPPPPAGGRLGGGHYCTVEQVSPHPNPPPAGEGISCWRLPFLLAALGLALFPLHPEQWLGNMPSFRIIAAQCLSLLGAALMIRGLMAWPLAHACCTRLDILLRRIAALPDWLFAAALFAAFLAVTISLSWYCFHFVPAICDSISQYIHAKFMAHGHLYGRTPAHKEFFPSCWMQDRGGKWVSIYQPLSVFMIALGHMVHAPWLTNPMEGGLTLLAMYFATRRICDEPTARIAAALTLGSQLILFMSAGYMNHGCSFLFTALFFLCYVEALERSSPSRPAWALGAGLSLGGIFLSRPLTAVEVGAPFIAYSLFLLWKNFRQYWPVFTAMAAAGSACMLFQGWYDWRTTGHILLMPYADVDGNVPWFNRGYTVWQGLLKAGTEWWAMSLTLFEWGTPSLLFALLACSAPLGNRYLRLLLAMLLSIIGFNMLNRWEFFNFGPRYIYEAALPLIILSAVGTRHFCSWLSSRHLSQSAARGITALMLCTFFASAFLYRLPDNIRIYAGHYVFNNPEFYASMRRQSRKPALIFLQQMPGNYPYEKYWWVDFASPPSRRAPIIFAIDLGDKNKQLMRFYPFRHAYLERDGHLYPIERDKSDAKR